MNAAAQLVPSESGSRFAIEKATRRAFASSLLSKYPERSHRERLWVRANRRFDQQKLQPCVK